MGTPVSRLIVWVKRGKERRHIMLVGEILIGVILYGFTVTVFYFAILKPAQRQREKMDTPQPYPRSVIDDKFIDGVMADRLRSIKDAREKHIAEVLMRWNPGEVAEPSQKTYDLLATKVLGLLTRYGRVDDFQRELGILLDNRFAKHPADLPGMAIYLTNWYKLA